MKMLAQLVDNLNLNSPLDIIVAACAVTAFWGQCCLGKLLPTCLSTLPRSPLLTCANFKRSLHNPQSCILHLPQTKTHRHGQDVVLVNQRQPINPISLLKRHLQLSGVTCHSHIFPYALAGGLVSLTKSLFLQRCNTIWHLLGYPHITGHCF
jgi:hypothetical protein